MSERTATIIGVTGMIGSYLLELLLKDNYYSTVRILVRRPHPKTDPKMEVKLVDFNDAESVKLALEGTNVIFSCVGTTQKKVKGDQRLYRKIDSDIPFNAARFGKEAGCEKFIMVSAVGANSRSKTFYLRLKGELEDSLEGLGLNEVHIMRPSLLLGKRTDARPTEKVLQTIMPAVSFLLPSKYKAIHGQEVAAAMVAASKQTSKGSFVYEYEGIKKLTA